MRIPRQQAGKLIALVIAALIIGWLGFKSYDQNRQVNEQFGRLFRAVQDKDTDTLAKLYHQELPAAYTKQLFKYPLLGWKITRLHEQPWPMETSGNYNCVMEAELYFTLPDRLVQPAGKYALRTTGEFAPCAVVPVTLKYFVDPKAGWVMIAPDLSDGLNWTAPFEGPVGKPSSKL